MRDTAGRLFQWVRDDLIGGHIESAITVNSSEETDRTPRAPERWTAKAEENLEEWGVQEPETLLLALQEELGELTQAHLEATHEDGAPERLQEELDDLGALLIQLDRRLP